MKNVIKGFKGFDKNMKCRGFQFSPNTDYHHPGDVKACESGFHFCESPLDVFNYYPPSDSKFYEVEGSGTIHKQSDDTKVACSHLKIGAELNLTAMAQAAIKFVAERVKVDKSDPKAHNTGYQSAASNTGYQSAASNTGYQSAATNVGEEGTAEVSGKESCACALGIHGKAKGAKGCFLTIAEWSKKKDGWHRICVKTTTVDGKKIKADTWYSLMKGKFTEVK
jgi:hypothetical protein